MKKGEGKETERVGGERGRERRLVHGKHAQPFLTSPPAMGVCCAVCTMLNGEHHRELAHCKIHTVVHTMLNGEHHCKPHTAHCTS